MRWVKKKHHIPMHGDTKIVREFLLCPLTIQDETRWLEIASIKYEYMFDLTIPGCTIEETHELLVKNSFTEGMAGTWIPVAWV